VSCLACDLAEGRRDLPGGRIHETAHWIVEHCVGPLGVGTLVVKPRRHVVHVSQLSEAESAEVGPLLTRTAAIVEALTRPDQVYVCLWSHAGWKPGHVHFVVQPVARELRELYPNQGPALQAAMFKQGTDLPPDDVEAFAERARQRFASS
jgi:diadenosine tetraphosphate (Ap4A) HIT family hydrolase